MCGRVRNERGQCERTVREGSARGQCERPVCGGSLRVVREGSEKAKCERTVCEDGERGPFQRAVGEGNERAVREGRGQSKYHLSRALCSARRAPDLDRCGPWTGHDHALSLAAHAHSHEALSLTNSATELRTQPHSPLSLLSLRPFLSLFVPFCPFLSLL